MTAVITIDGPSGSGKGTISQLLAKKLGWHFLDSGALYRIVAFAALKKHIDLHDEEQLQKLAANLDVQFTADGKIILDKQDITFAIRTEECSKAASIIAALPLVRQALLARQRSFRKAPGLIADGRDMGNVVFPDADLKIFLTASQAERASRRHKQLLKNGINVTLEEVLQEIIARDRRDEERNVAPLKPADDAKIIDTTDLTIDEVLNRVMEYAKGVL